MTATIIASFCIIGFASAVHAMTGFGFALVGVPLLTIALDSHTAVVTINAVDVVLTVMIVARERGHIQWRSASVVTIAGLVGIPIGIWVLSIVSKQALTVVIALVVLLFTFALARGFHLPRGKTTEGAAGVSSGVLLATTGMNGPPLVAAFQAMEMPPRTFRATLQAVFAVQATIVVAGYAVTDQFNGSSITASLAAIPALFVGWFVGDKIFHRIAGPQFKYVVLGTMAVAAVLALVTAFG